MGDAYTSSRASEVDNSTAAGVLESGGRLSWEKIARSCKVRTHSMRRWNTVFTVEQWSAAHDCGLEPYDRQASRVQGLHSTALRTLCDEQNKGLVVFPQLFPQRHWNVTTKIESRIIVPRGVQVNIKSNCLTT